MQLWKHRRMKPNERRARDADQQRMVHRYAATSLPAGPVPILSVARSAPATETGIGSCVTGSGLSTVRRIRTASARVPTQRAGCAAHPHRFGSDHHHLQQTHPATSDGHHPGAATASNRDPGNGTDKRPVIDTDAAREAAADSGTQAGAVTGLGNGATIGGGAVTGPGCGAVIRPGTSNGVAVRTGTEPVISTGAAIVVGAGRKS